MFPSLQVSRHHDRSTGWRRCVLAGLLWAAPSMALAATDPRVAASLPSVPTDCGDAQMTKQTSDGTVVTRTSGLGETVTVVTRGPNGEIRLDQSGPCNDAEIRQGGSNNKSTVSQHGSGNRVVVRQGSPAGEAK